MRLICASTFIIFWLFPWTTPTLVLLSFAPSDPIAQVSVSARCVTIWFNKNFSYIERNPIAPDDIFFYTKQLKSFSPNPCIAWVYIWNMVYKRIRISLLCPAYFLFCFLKSMLSLFSVDSVFVILLYGHSTLPCRDNATKTPPYQIS